MEFDKWARKLVRELNASGFEMEKARSTSHRQFKYIGTEMQFPDLVTVPTQIKSTSRVKTIATIKKKLRQFSAPTEIINRFDNLALGLLSAEDDDNLDELEAKLYEALSAKNIIAVAELSAEIQIYTHKHNSQPYKSVSLERFKDEADTNKQKQLLIAEIDRQLEKLFKAAVNVYLEEFGEFSINPRHFSRNNEEFKLDVGKSAAFGFNIVVAVKERYESHFTITGNLNLPLSEIFSSLKESPMYEIHLENDSGDEEEIYFDNQSLSSFHVYIDKCSLDDIKDNATKVDKKMTLFHLKGDRM